MNKVKYSEKSQALPQRIKTYWVPCENYITNLKDCQVE